MGLRDAVSLSATFVTLFLIPVYCLDHETALFAPKLTSLRPSRAPTKNVLAWAGDMDLVAQTVLDQKMTVVCLNGVRLAYSAVASVLSRGVAGDIAEFGVFTGGTSAAMQAALVHAGGGIPSRLLWMVDSFVRNFPLI